MGKDRTFASLFTGGGGADIGALDAGLEPTWGIEYDAEIAAIARHNLGDYIHIMNILGADPEFFERPFAIHASPPCPNFSVAKNGAKETENDIALAQKVADFISVLQPEIFTLENVYKYRFSESWKLIAETLHERGYWFDLAHVNTADFGVPQTRRRMIVRAIKGQMVPMLPPAEPWVGWYEAIEDLIPLLPESKFAKWQLEKLPELFETRLVDSAGYPDDDGVTIPVMRNTDEPANTIVANYQRRKLRAFLMQVQGEGGDGIRGDSEPIQTIAANHGAKKYRAYLFDGQNTRLENDGYHPTVREENEPSITIAGTKYSHRAFIVGGQFGQPQGSENRPPQTRETEEPIFTVTAVNKGDWRAWLENGQVVAMTPRALARFQSFPDWYELPEKSGLACKIIGNACPPLMMAKIYRQLLEVVGNGKA